MTPRIFVGTMHCGEGEFDACKKAIGGQVGVNQWHVVISDMAEMAAHNALWHEWRAAKHNFNMFVKVDADTVLAHPEVLLEFWLLMEANPRITGIQAPLLDYFTAGYINGLNCFSPLVTFRDTADELFCDRRVDVDHDIVIGSEQVPERLRPAGYHCYHVTDAQAFHFGLHRALKNQVDTLERVRQSYLKEKDRARALVLLGASVAPQFRAGGFNYTDDRFKTVLANVQEGFKELEGSL